MQRRQGGYGYQMKPGEPFSPYRIFGSVVVLPNALLQSGLVSDAAKLVLGRLYQYAGKNETCFPGRDELSHELHMSPRKITRCLAELEDAGFLTSNRRGQGLTAEYTPLWHAIYEDVD